MGCVASEPPGGIRCPTGSCWIPCEGWRPAGRTCCCSTDERTGGVCRGCWLPELADADPALCRSCEGTPEPPPSPAIIRRDRVTVPLDGKPGTENLGRLLISCAFTQSGLISFCKTCRVAYSFWFGAR